MRIAILGSRGYPSTYGGFETFIRHFVPHALEMGHDILVYCRWKENGASKWRSAGAECRNTRSVDTTNLSTLTFGLTSSWDVRTAGVEAALVVNCANGLWLPLLGRANIPAVINVDGLEWDRGKWNRLARTVFRTGARMAARHADALVADSAVIADIWETEFGVRPSFIPYGAPIVSDDAGNLVSTLGFPLGEYGLTVARLVPENNVDLTLDALETMGSDRPPWVVVGSAVGSSPLENRLRALSNRPDVWWLGHVSDQALLSQLWRHCAVYVHGHSVGGTNPSLLQAMGAGAPTVAFDTPFTREVLTDDGLFYSDSQSLTALIRGVLYSPETRRTLSTSGRERVESAYSWDTVCERYLALLAQVRGRARPAAVGPGLERVRY